MFAESQVCRRCGAGTNSCADYRPTHGTIQCQRASFYPFFLRYLIKFQRLGAFKKKINKILFKFLEKKEKLKEKIHPMTKTHWNRPEVLKKNFKKILKKKYRFSEIFRKNVFFWRENVDFKKKILFSNVLFFYFASFGVLTLSGAFLPNVASFNQEMSVEMIFLRFFKEERPAKTHLFPLFNFRMVLGKKSFSFSNVKSCIVQGGCLCLCDCVCDFVLMAFSSIEIPLPQKRLENCLNLGSFRSWSLSKIESLRLLFECDPSVSEVLWYWFGKFPNLKIRSHMLFTAFPLKLSSASGQKCDSTSRNTLCSLLGTVKNWFDSFFSKKTTFESFDFIRLEWLGITRKNDFLPFLNFCWNWMLSCLAFFQ